MQTYSQLKNTLDGAGLTDSEKQHMINLLSHRSMNKDNTDRFDDAYMHCLLRPEEATSTRIPSEYGRQSCVLKQHTSFTVSTGALGEGLFAWLPQDLHYSAGVFVTEGASENAPTLQGQGAQFDTYKRLNFLVNLMNADLSENFQAARVVGASMVVRWIGDDDDETGILVGSHQYDYNVALLDTDKIDNGHHAVQHRPSKGLRMIYLPRNNQDFEFCSLDTRLNTNKVASTYFGLNCMAFNPAEYTRGGTIAFDGLNEKTLFLQQRGVSSAETDVLRFGTPVWSPTPSVDSRQPLDYIGTGPKAAYMNNPLPQICAFYWKGMPAIKPWLKIDIVRHLELVPRPFLREMVSMSRPLHCAESQKLAVKLANKDSRHVVASLEHSEQLKPLVTAGIATAHNNDSLLGMINHALWPPSWSGPIGDMARFINRPQKELFQALTGMTDQQYLQGIIPAGIAAVGTVATGGAGALVPFVAGAAEAYLGKEVADVAMNYLTSDSNQNQAQDQRQGQTGGTQRIQTNQRINRLI